MDKAEKKHRDLVERLTLRLLDKNYDAVLMNPTYHVDNKVGELDVLAIRGNHANYYEVKCHDSYKRRHKAGEQINRVKQAFPQWDIRGVYVSPEKIRRFK